MAYQSFSDVISFDTTYCTNKYSMPFAPFIVKDPPQSQCKGKRKPQRLKPPAEKNARSHELAQIVKKKAITSELAKRRRRKRLQSTSEHSIRVTKLVATEAENWERKKREMI
uniref:Uncharacterized protein n=1 Tax=Ananas comosus var. bracteatus TaxID=296719 RepID=A0A6V7PUU0_ANACO|nr:unnamed protein product [Ananas comosus var. bracteatus]